MRRIRILNSIWLAGVAAAVAHAQTAPSFSPDDWRLHLRAPEAPTRSQLYQGDSDQPATPSPATAPVSLKTTPLPAASHSAAAKSDNDRLAAIAIADRDFFQAFNTNPDTWPEAERNRRAQAIFDQYTAYITDHPDDVQAIVLYGKFLYRVGEKGLAYEVFRRADQLDPNLAVVKQQMANHFAEASQPAEALELLKKAEALAPSEPVYHYEMGELLNIFYDKFVAAKTYDTAGLDQAMEAEFARAMALAPQEKGYAWRHAECYYDQQNPDWNAALVAWAALAAQTTDSGEVQTIRLHRARTLIELGRFDEARSLLELPVELKLGPSRAALLKRLPASPAPGAATAT